MAASNESVSLSCSLKVSFLDSKGTPTRQLSDAKSYLILGRNEFRDILLKIQCGKSKLSFGMQQDLVLHTKFVKEGKATIALPSLQLFLSNCPTAKLRVFLKTLAAKVKRRKGVQGPLQPPLPLTTFQEISPLTNLDLQAIRQVVPPTTPKSRTNVERPLASRGLLSVEQRRVLSAVLSGRSVFFTGAAGTGKSFLLQRLLATLAPDETFATASTGLAACHIGGMTLHAFAGAGLWRRCRHLVVDEVSMVDGRFFEELDRAAQRARRSSKPFGGIQLILCGDFLQLPPVVKPGNKRLFCFQTPAWEKCIDVTIELSQVKRQKDRNFIEILQNVRKGRLKGSHLETLKATASHQLSCSGILPTQLSTHKDDVELINRTHLAQLTGDVRSFEAEDSEPSQSGFISRHCHAASRLELKRGCQVMLIKNLDVPKGLVNGARGVVTDFAKESNVPVVRFACGVEQEVPFERWSLRAPSGTQLTRRMLPLQLAWAMSIHKSQGMTLDCVEVSLGRVFECGQAYVALSRARSLEGLRVLDIQPSSVRADPTVLDFYDRLDFTGHLT